MGYSSLQQAVVDLEQHGHLVRIPTPVDPVLEAAEIQRRIFRAGGPAVLFEKTVSSPFSMVSNLFGTKERVHFLFRDSLAGIRALVNTRVDPTQLLRMPQTALRLPSVAPFLFPISVKTGPSIQNKTRISQLPKLVSWPDDGGPFVTLPQVYSEDPAKPGLSQSNLGMYRIQLGGNQYVQDQEIGLHYQIHRGIGVHHSSAIRRGEKLRVSVFVGGPPSMMVAAVMPLPEGLPEIAFAGALNRRNIRMIRTDSFVAHADADFVITGWVDPAETKPEGPFGDHLGYYAKTHDFPVLHVENVFHRDGAIWPFTVVGRPPQEDTLFGELIHELTAPLIPTVLPGIKEVHAVDAAGVHPLLLAIGSERYVPYAKQRRPMELLTQSNAILGQGQMSLAKYLFIAAQEDDRELKAHDVERFFWHILERVDPQVDLHFIGNTTIDTLDYSGTGLNQGSKVIVAAAGQPKRRLCTEIPSNLKLPDGFSDARLVSKGIIAVTGPSFAHSNTDLRRFCEELAKHNPSLMSESVSSSSQARKQGNHNPQPNHAHELRAEPILFVLCDDADFVAKTFDNFLWVAFTRSNPCYDIDGLGAFVEHKTWGCKGPIVIDARRKPHHAPPLVESPEITAKVDQLFTKNGPLGAWG